MSIRYYFYKIIHVTLLMGLSIILLVALLTAVVKWYLIPQLPSTEHLKEVRFQVPLKVYSKDGQLIEEFGEQRRIPIAAHDIPPSLIKAVLAAEDDRFFDHPGVDLKSLVRALVNLIKTGERQQGASTITMQVARNFFLSPERTFGRKFKEILLALKIENEFTKEDILVLYLNKIFFGHRAYGIRAAAQVYYGKKVEELTLSELAMLAALPKAPSVSNPLTNSERALERRNYILARMRELNYITAQQFQEAVLAPNTAMLHKLETQVEAPYVAEMVRNEMIKRFGEELAYTEGYRVYTTLEPELQRLAQKALRDALYAYDERHGYRGPLGHVKLPKNNVQEKADDVLQNYPMYADLLPSIVLENHAKSVIAYNPKLGEFSIAWQDLAWAHRYRGSNHVGGTPRSASNIVRRGDIILVRPVAEKVKQDKIEPPSTKNRRKKMEEQEPHIAPEKIRWKLAEIPQIEGALVSLDPNNGAIVALAGGFDFYHSNFNRITQADRQPGSNFKPFIYSAALDMGFTANSIINDAPIVFTTGKTVWRPTNFSHKFYGPTSLRNSLAQSRNVASVRLLAKIGVKRAIDYVVKFGFKRERIPQNLTIALGTNMVTPLELATGYTVFANGGYLVEPYFIERIEDAQGNVIFQANPLQVCRTCPPEILSTKTDHEGLFISETDCAPEPRYAKRIISPYNAAEMTSILKDVIRIGTGRKASELKRNDIAGKTGTTNEMHDAWFSGYNPDIVTTAWVGFDQPRSLGSQETGGRAALPMWVEFMRGALKGKPEKFLPLPKGGTATEYPRLKLRLSDHENEEGLIEKPFTQKTGWKRRDDETNTKKIFIKKRKNTAATSSGSNSGNEGRKGGTNSRSTPRPSIIPDQLF